MLLLLFAVRLDSRVCVSFLVVGVPCMAGCCAFVLVDNTHTHTHTHTHTPHPTPPHVPARIGSPRRKSGDATTLRRRGSAGSVQLPPITPKFGRARSNDRAALPFNVAVPEDRQLLVSAIVHTCDLSGQAYGEVVSAEWSRRIATEFRNQALREQELGLPVTPFMANLSTPLQVAKLQYGFMTFVVVPLWRAVGGVLKGLDVRCCGRSGAGHHAWRCGDMAMCVCLLCVCVCLCVGSLCLLRSTPGLEWCVLDMFWICFSRLTFPLHPCANRCH